MEFITKTTLLGLVCLFLSSNLFATDFIIIESRSNHPFQKMDVEWLNLITQAGHTGFIQPQTALDDYETIADADVVIVSSGLIGMDDSRRATLKQFVENGGNVYVQSEYQVTRPGNLTFKYLVDELGGEFNWLGELSGNLAPVSIVGDLANLIFNVSSLDFFWYATYGEGNNTITPFMQSGNYDVGFVFTPPSWSYGKVITTTDQDWIRLVKNEELLLNIIGLLNTPTEELPEVSLSVTNENPCPGESVIFTANMESINATAIYNWFLNGNPIDGETTATLELNNHYDGDFVECIVTLNDGVRTGEINTDPIILTQLIPIYEPTIDIIASQNRICQNEDIVFTAMATEGLDNLSYQWQLNGQDIANETSENYTISNLNHNDEVQCIISFNDVCEPNRQISSAPIQIEVEESLTPDISITATTTNICQGEEVVFTATGNHHGTNPSYQWKINGVNIGADAPTFTSYELIDGQSIKCVVTSSETCTTANIVDSESIQVNVSTIAMPTIQIQASTLNICQGEEITFTTTGNDLGINPTYQWQVDGVDMAVNTANFTTTQLQDGQSIVCNVVADNRCALSNLTNTETLTVAVSTPLSPSLAVSSNVDNICAGEEVVFEATGVDLGENATYDWQVNGQSTGNNTHTFSTTSLSNNQIVTCLVSLSETCATQQTVLAEAIPISISIPQTPVIEISADRASICTGGSINFTATGQHLGDTPSYQWHIDGELVGENTASFNSSTVQAGQIVSLVVNSSESCISNIEAVSNPITIQSSDIIVELMEYEAAQCGDKNGFVELEAVGGQAPYTYTWSNELSGNVAGELSAGEYTVMVEDATGCSKEMNITIENIEAPQILAVDSRDTYCDNTNGAANVILDDVNEHLTYKWTNNNGDIISDKATVNNLSPGDYMVEVSNEYGCTAIEEITIYEGEVMEVKTSENTQIKLGERVALSTIVSGVGAMSYEWSPAIGLSCTDCPNPIASPEYGITYSVTISNEYGCSITKEIVVDVDPARAVFIPNAFSPNGDGNNDELVVSGGVNVERVKTFRVFNRAGAMVFEAQNFQTDDPSSGWNGSFRGQKAKRGVYVFLAEVQFIDGATEVFKGDVTIME